MANCGLVNQTYSGNVWFTRLGQRPHSVNTLACPSPEKQERARYLIVSPTGNTKVQTQTITINNFLNLGRKDKFSDTKFAITSLVENPTHCVRMRKTITN